MSTDAAGSERIISMQSPCRMLSIGRSAGVAVRCFVAGVFTRSITPMVRPCFHVKEGLDESRRLCRQARDSKESDAGNGERKESPTTYGVARDSGRAEERRVWTTCVILCISRWWPYQKQK